MLWESQRYILLYGRRSPVAFLCRRSLMWFVGMFAWYEVRSKVRSSVNKRGCIRIFKWFLGSLVLFFFCTVLAILRGRACERKWLFMFIYGQSLYSGLYSEVVQIYIMFTVFIWFEGGLFLAPLFCGFAVLRFIYLRLREAVICTFWRGVVSWYLFWRLGSFEINLGIVIDFKEAFSPNVYNV